MCVDTWGWEAAVMPGREQLHAARAGSDYDIRPDAAHCWGTPPLHSSAMAIPCLA